MNDRTDQELLKDYARRGSEAAFNELVRRHTDLVYSTAARLVVDSHLAEDVSQRVFIALAQNARKLSGRATLGGWLHLTTHNFAVMTIRTEERRRVREQEAMSMLSDSPDANVVWDHIAPHLDTALTELNDADRDVMVLRFFERKTAREIGTHLGLSEEAAQKRVTRAMEKLREVFRLRGMVLPAAAVAGAISAQAVQAAPAGLAAAFAAKALTDTTVALSLAASTVKVLNVMAQMKAHPIAAAIVIVACLSLGTTGFVTGKKAAKRHHAATVWQLAVVASEPEPTTVGAPTQTVNSVRETSAPRVSPEPSVAEILAEAANYFRAEKTDPDAWVKGFVALEKLRPGEAMQALQQLESYRNEPAVFRQIGPRVMGLLAETDPRAAIRYAVSNFNSGTLSISLQRISQSWASREPAAVWAWYLETTSKLPETPGLWQWPIFSEWAARDTPGAFDQLAKVSLADERAAILGISNAARMAENRPAILAAIARISDEDQRRRVAEAVARNWAELDPQAAVQWTAGLEFQNPAARSIVMRKALSGWSQFDPHVAAVWTVTHAPREILTMLMPDKLEKLREAAR